MTCLRIRVVFVPLLWCSFLALAGSTHAHKETEHSGHHGGRHRGGTTQLRPASFNVDEVMRKLAPKD